MSKQDVYRTALATEEQRYTDLPGACLRPLSHLPPQSPEGWGPLRDVRHGAMLWTLRPAPSAPDDAMNILFL
jgi:hypothetical protein